MRKKNIHLIAYNSRFLILPSKQEYWELSSGVLVSGHLDFDQKTSFVPYGGLQFSILRGSADGMVDYSDTGVNAKLSANVEEKDLLSAIFGGSFLFGKNFSIRVEGRVIGDSRISAAISIAF